MTDQLTEDPPAQDPPLVEPAAPAAGAWHALREWGIVVGIALLVAVVIRTFAIAPFYIPSDSMFDTLSTDDRILVNKLSYRLHDVHRGDVVVFEKPPGVNFGSDEVEDLIKRVIGVPGDVLAFRDCSVFVNGQRLEEPYTDGQCTESDYVVIRSVGQHVDARVVRKHPRASGFWPLIARAASSRASTRVTESEREIARMMEGRVKPPNDHRR